MWIPWGGFYQGGMNTEPGTFSLSWVRYQCALWHHKGPIAKLSAEKSSKWCTFYCSKCVRVVNRIYFGCLNWLFELQCASCKDTPSDKNAFHKKEKNMLPSEWAWVHLYAFLSTLFICFFTWSPAVYKSSCGAATLHFSPVNTHFNLTGDSAWHKLNHLPLYNHLFQKDTERETEQPVRIMWIDCKSAAPTWLQSR